MSQRHNWSNSGSYISYVADTSSRPDMVPTSSIEPTLPPSFVHVPLQAVVMRDDWCRCGSGGGTRLPETDSQREREHVIIETTLRSSAMG